MESPETSASGVHAINVENSSDLLNDIQSAHLNEESKKKLETLLLEYRDVFNTPDTKLTATSVVKLRIITEDVPPIVKRPYRVPYTQKPALDKELGLLLRDGIIQESSSPWSFPLIMVTKKPVPGEKEARIRICIDYRELNKITKSDFFPLPNLVDTIDTLSGSKIFSVLDLSAGYFQIRMDDRDIEKTAFSTYNAHYEWIRMPMGLKNSPSSFQRLMYAVFAGLIGIKCLVYLDDVIVFSIDDEDEHLRRLQDVFECMRKYNLKFKPSKCQFLKKEVKYLGHIISASGVGTDKEKTKAIDNYPRPETRKEIRAFLGLAGFYRRFVSRFSEIAQPLYNLLKEDVPFVWEVEAEEAFKKLKKALITPPVLRFPDFQKPFIVSCDASISGISAILSQKIPHEGEYVISYASRTLNRAERNYSTTERELLAIVWGVNHYKCYLIGTHFTVITDHKPLKYIMSLKNPSARLAKWTMKLLEYSFEIQYRAGGTHLNADALTRLREEKPEKRPSINTIQTPQDDSLVNNTTYLPLVWDLETLKREQQSDPAIQLLKNRHGYYESPDGFIYRNRQNEERYDQLIVPKSLQAEILALHHQTPYSCHLGTQKTLALIKMKFYWTKMTADIKRYVSHCYSCNIHKTTPVPPADMIAAVPTHVFGKISIDIVGPLSITKKGHRYLFTCIDYLTRYAECVPLTNISAESVAKAFVEKIILRHGVPDILLSDNGPQFISKLFREVCRLLGIKKLFTTIYRPQCNAVLERLHKSLKQMISHFVTEKDPDWDQWIDYALMSYRNCVHSSTGETPFYLMFGRDMKLPSHLPTVSNHNLTPDYASDLRDRLDRTHKQTHKRLEEVAIKQAERFNKKTKTRTYKEGDLVFLKQEVRAYSHLSSSFQPKWAGPYRIIQIISPVNYKIRNLATGKELSIHVNRLKLYPTPSIIQEQPVEKSAPITTKDPSLQLHYPMGTLAPFVPPVDNDVESLDEWFDPIDHDNTDSDLDNEHAADSRSSSDSEEIIPHNFFDEPVVLTDTPNEESSDELSDNESLEHQHPYHTRRKGPVADQEWVLKRAI